jgi:hypothetical protein
MFTEKLRTHHLYQNPRSNSLIYKSTSLVSTLSKTNSVSANTNFNPLALELDI